MATLDQAAGIDRLEFVCNGGRFVTGPVMVDHLSQASHRMKEAQESGSIEPLYQFTILITLLFDDAGLIPGDLTEWNQKTKWIGKQFSVAQLIAANRVIDESMPEELVRASKEAARSIAPKPEARTGRKKR